MNDYLDFLYPLDPVYRRLYRAVWEAIQAELPNLTGSEREAAYEILEEMEDDEWDREDLRDHIYMRREAKFEQCDVLLPEFCDIRN